MFEQIAELVKQMGQQTVVENPEVPDNENNAVLAEAANTVTGGLQNMLAGGGLESVLSLFNTKGGNGQSGNTLTNLLKNPIVLMMIGHFAGKLMSKFKMNASQANSVATNLIPNVLTSLVDRTNSSASNDSGFDIGNILNSLTGGKAGGLNIGSLISQFTGGGQGNSGGGFDIGSIISQITQGAAENKEQQIRSVDQGGGLQNILRNLFN